MDKEGRLQERVINSNGYRIVMYYNLQYFLYVMVLILNLK